MRCVVFVCFLFCGQQPTQRVNACVSVLFDPGRRFFASCLSLTPTKDKLTRSNKAEEWVVFVVLQRGGQSGFAKKKCGWGGRWGERRARGGARGASKTSRAMRAPSPLFAPSSPHRPRVDGHIDAGVHKKGWQHGARGALEAVNRHGAWQPPRAAGWGTPSFVSSQNASRVRNPVGSSPSNAGVGASVCAVRRADEGHATTAAAATALRAAAAESGRERELESDALLRKRASMMYLLVGERGRAAGRRRETSSQTRCVLGTTQRTTPRKPTPRQQRPRSVSVCVCVQCTTTIKEARDYECTRTQGWHETKKNFIFSPSLLLRHHKRGQRV